MVRLQACGEKCRCGAEDDGGERMFGREAAEIARRRADCCSATASGVAAASSYALRRLLAARHHLLLQHAASGRRYVCKATMSQPVCKATMSQPGCCNLKCATRRLKMCRGMTVMQLRVRGAAALSRHTFAAHIRGECTVAANVLQRCTTNAQR